MRIFIMTLKQRKQLNYFLWLVMMKDFILNIWFYQPHIRWYIYWYQDCKVLSILDDLNLRVQDYTSCRVHKFLCSQIHQNIGRNQLYWQQSMHLWNWSNIRIIMFPIYIVLFQNFSPLCCNFTYASIEADKSEIGEMNSKHLAWPALQVWVHESIPLTQ